MDKDFWATDYKIETRQKADCATRLKWLDAEYYQHEESLRRLRLEYNDIENELNTVIKQYEAVVKQNRELQQENKRLLNLVSIAQKCSDEASYVYYAAITDPQKRANAIYKIYEDLKNAIKEVQNV